MNHFNLAFRAYDVHELGCHFVARHAGLYRRHGLEDPRLIDMTFLAEDKLPPRSFQAACAGALAAWLFAAPLRVVFVAADRPMFWLYGAPGVTRLDELQGQVVAGYPAVAPPAIFLRGTWARPGQGREGLRMLACRDDVARIGLLREGSAKGALISSAVSPDAMAALGFQPLLFFGDELRFATTGLAAQASLCEEEPELVARLCACYQEAIALVHSDGRLVERALADVPGIGTGGATAMVATVQRCYTTSGRCSPGNLASGVEFMARALEIEPRPAEDFYDFSFLA